MTYQAIAQDFVASVTQLLKRNEEIAASLKTLSRSIFRKTVSIAGSFPLLLLSTVAFAEDNYRLDYSAPPECIAKERFADEVAARAGRLVFDDVSPASVAVRIVRDGDTFLATLQVDGQSRVATAATCESATTQLAEAAAVLFQAEAPVVAPAPSAPRDNGEITVRLTSDQPGFTAHRIAMRGQGQSGTVTVAVVGTERLCTAPCEFSLLPGNHELAAAPDAQAAIGTRGTALDLRQPSELHGIYTSRRGLRIGLGVAGLALAVAGTIMLLTLPDSETCAGPGLYENCSSNPAYTPWLVGSVVGLAAGSGLALSIAYIPDTAEWQVRPLRLQ